MRVCVVDWKPMLARVNEVIAELKASPPPLPVDEVAEALQFLEWLARHNFTFLGFRSYVFPDRERNLEPQWETGLGILRAAEVRILRRGSELVSITPEIMEFLNEPKTLIITKANVRSRIHRRVHMDYVGVKHFDTAGTLIGEYRFIGLFTSTAYTRSTRSIPYLRRKVAAVLTRAGFDPDGHSGKALANVLDTYPRDELFQIDEDTLYRNALMVMQLLEHPRIRVLARRDRFDRFVSVLVYVPRDRFASGTRAAIGNFLAETYKGRISALYPFFPEARLVRVHFIIGRDEGETPSPDRASLELAVAAIVRTWIDELHNALALVHDAVKAQSLLKRYRNAFSIAYQEAYPPATAVGDIRVIDNLSALRPLAVDFCPLADRSEAAIGLKVWSYDRPIPLSERVPVLENMGFRVVDERTYRIEPAATGELGAWLHDMVVERADGRTIDIAALEQRLEACFLTVMRGHAENDGYNALVLEGGLPWRDIALVRTISRFLRQVRVPYSQDYMWATLRKHAGLAAEIVALFHMRFDPRLAPSPAERSKRETEIRTRIETALKDVESLDEDRILRRFVNAVEVGVAHQLLSDRRERPTEGRDRDKIRQSQHREDAGPAPALRNLRLFAAGGRRAPAVRQGRPRRLALVRPAAGFPHRGPRPGQGPAGEKCRHRAGRVQRRFRPQATARRRPARSDPDRRRRRLHHIRVEPARHHRQYRTRRRDRPAQRGPLRRR